MEEIEKTHVIERTEQGKIIEKSRLKRDEFEKSTIECPECHSHTSVRDYEHAELVCAESCQDENYILIRIPAASCVDKITGFWIE